MQPGVIRTVVIGMLGVALLAGSAVSQDPPLERRTELVQLIQRCGPSAVNLVGYVPMEDYPGSFTLSWGSGTIIHESGFIVTNDHVANTEGQQVVVLQDGRQFPYTVVAANPQEDLALIRVMPDQPLMPLELGRSDDLMLGEPVLVIGNPGGLTHTISTGIITGVNRVGGGGATMLTGMIQTDAPVNGGNSGGPMINALGQLIGIIESKRTDADGLGFAIQVDRFRNELAAMLSVEARYGFELGMEVAPLPQATVMAVEPGSPAEAAGVQVGDVVTSVGEMAIRDGVHFYLALVDREGGQTLPMTLTRAGQIVDVEVTLSVRPPRPAEQVEDLQPGIYLQAYLGQWEQLPDFDQLQPVSGAPVPAFGLYVQGTVSDYFGLKFTGYIDVPAEGLYTFITHSDDGTKLWIGDELVVDNDGLHGAVDAAGLIRLAAGTHPITVTFFEHGGDEVLSVSYEGPGIARQTIPPGVLFCTPPDQPPALQPSQPATPTTAPSPVDPS